MNAVDHLFDVSIERLIRRARASGSALGGFPHYADPETGTWFTTTDGSWTGGFLPGMLWLDGYLTGHEESRGLAEQWLARLEGRIESDSLFRGFLFFYGAVLGVVLAGSPIAEAFASRAAHSLCRTYNERAKLLPLGRAAEEAHAVGEGDANIDGITTSFLLAWAAERENDFRMKEVAIQHALTSGTFFVRSDGSVCQSATFDQSSGLVSSRFTHKGYSDHSTWTRAQAWAMLGYSQLANLFPEQPEFVELAERTADWWMAHAPSDRVAYWDFDAPAGDDTPRDTSGTAIAAAALMRLSRVHRDRQAALYCRRYAVATVTQLCMNYLTPVTGFDERPAGILTEGCFDSTRKLAPRHELVWGDYFLLEALLLVTGSVPIGLF